MATEEFKEKAAGCAGDCDVYELCLTHLRGIADSENQLVALKVLDIFEELMS